MDGGGQIVTPSLLCCIASLNAYMSPVSHLQTSIDNLDFYVCLIYMCIWFLVVVNERNKLTNSILWRFSGDSGIDEAKTKREVNKMNVNTGQFPSSPYRI